MTIEQRFPAILLALTLMGSLSGSSFFANIKDVENPPVPNAASDEAADVTEVSALNDDTLIPQSSTAQDLQEALLTQFILNYNRKLSMDEARSIANSVLTFSEEYNLDFRLVTSLIAVESTFRSDAVSSSGAIGLGQLKPSTAKWLGVKDPYDPHDNIGGMTKYLSYLHKRYNGNSKKALSAYFMGPGAVDRHGITDSCHYYLSKINKVMNRF